jgi:acetamidase/formamidase
MAYGGNLDDPNIVAGTTIYFPVFVEGALFSIGDGHAAQGHGEVSGTAIEAPLRIVYRVNVIKGGPAITEPQYETDDFYAVTAFATTLDEAAKKATRFMIAHFVDVHGLERHQANMLSSVAADLKIAAVVNGNVLVSMHISKSLFSGR